MSEIIKLDNMSNTDDLNNSKQEAKVSIFDFVKKYDAVSSDQIRQKMLANAIYAKDYYVPYAVKTVVANQIIEQSNFNKNGDVYYNGPKQYQIYIAALLSLYTNFDVSGDAFDQAFDVLNRGRLLDELVENMPEDKAEFDIVFSMAKDDFDRNYVDKKQIDNIVGAVYKGFIKGLNDILDGMGIDGLSMEDVQEIINREIKTQLDSD